MNAFCDFFKEYSHAALTGMAVGLSILLVGGGSIIVGGIYILWRLLDALHLPTMELFRGACWLFYWPGILIESGSDKPDELLIVTLSGLGWFVCLALFLNAGRFIVRRFVD